MASVIVTFKIMPESPDESLEKIEKDVSHLITEFGGKVGKVEQDPIGFGLTALKIMFVMDEAIGATDDLEEQVKQLKEVSGCDVCDIRRTIG